MPDRSPRPPLKLLLALPIVGALAYLAFAAALDDAASGYYAARQVVLVFAAVSSVAAAMAFRRGEYMWWAWAVTAACPAASLADDVLPGATLAGSAGSWAHLALYAVLNLASLAGALLFAAAILRGGLGLPGERRTQLLVVAATAAVAVAVAAPALRLSLAQLAEGHPLIDVAVDVASTTFDALCFLLAAPLLVTAVALRGSALASAFWLLGLSNLAWLVSDGLLALGRDAPAWLVPGRAVLLAAILAMASASWVHRRAVGAAARPAAQPAAEGLTS